MTIWSSTLRLPVGCFSSPTVSDGRIGRDWAGGGPGPGWAVGHRCSRQLQAFCERWNALLKTLGLETRLLFFFFFFSVFIFYTCPPHVISFKSLKDLTRARTTAAPSRCFSIHRWRTGPGPGPAFISSSSLVPSSSISNVYRCYFITL